MTTVSRQSEVLFRSALLFAPLWLMPAGPASAESYFCSPAPIKLGSYRPDDSTEALDIRVSFPDAEPFWFDDQSGDFMSFAGGVAGPPQPRKLRIPLPDLPTDKLEGLVLFAMTGDQCQPAEMGAVPPMGTP